MKVIYLLLYMIYSLLYIIVHRHIDGGFKMEIPQWIIHFNLVVSTPLKKYARQMGVYYSQ